MRNGFIHLVTGTALAIALSASSAYAQKKYDTGASDTEIKVGQTVRELGPFYLVAFGVLALKEVVPQLSSAAVQGLPPHQFGAGSAVGQALRNLGSTFGVALTIAFTTSVTGSPLDRFHRVWWLLATCGVLVSMLSTRLVHRSAGAAAPAVAAVALD